MSEVDPLFDEMMQTLRYARTAVLAEPELQAGAPARDKAALKSLRNSLREFGDQSESLALIMEATHTGDDMLAEAAELGDVFHDAQKRIEMMLVRDRA